MSTRYYLADIVGTGEADVDEFRAAVADHGVAFDAGFPADPNTGHPLRDWTLAIVRADDHAPLISDVRLDALPDYPLDGKLSGMGEIVKAEMIAAMQRRQIENSTEGMDTYREVIRMIGAAANSTFNENSFSA